MKKLLVKAFRFGYTTGNGSKPSHVANAFVIALVIILAIA